MSSSRRRRPSSSGWRRGSRRPIAGSSSTNRARREPARRVRPNDRLRDGPGREGNRGRRGARPRRCWADPVTLRAWRRLHRDSGTGVRATPESTSSFTPITCPGNGFSSTDRTRGRARLVQPARPTHGRRADEPAPPSLERPLRRAVRRHRALRRAGLHEFGEGQKVEPFDVGDELPGGMVAYEVGASVRTRRRCTFPLSRLSRWRTERFAGSPVVRSRSSPTSSWTIPRRTKAGLREAYRRVATLDFRHLLLAHGEPVLETGREALADFAR